MAWKEKLNTAIEHLDADPMFTIVFKVADPNLEFVDSLRADHPHLDSVYLEFLTMTDGAHFWMYTIAGSGISDMVSVGKLAERWSGSASHLELFTIGESPSGECIGMTTNGAILEFDYTAETQADCKELAPSFAELLDHFFMGKGFAASFANPDEDLKDDLWAQFLRIHGWY